MSNDVHYIAIFVTFFIILGVAAPLLADEFGSGISGGQDGDVISAEDAEDTGLLTYGAVLLNIVAIPFWTFGLPAWFNLSILLIIRVIFLFVIGRNIWVGGGS